MSRKLLIKILVFTISIILVYKLAAFIGTQKIENLIQESLQEKDSLNYSNISINFLSGSLSLEKPIFLRDSIRFTAKELNINNVSYYKYLNNDELHISEIELIEGSIEGVLRKEKVDTIHKNENKKNIENVIINSVKISDFGTNLELENGYQIVLDTTNAFIEDININLNNLKSSSFNKETLQLNFNNFTYQYSSYQQVGFKNLQIANKVVSIKDLKIDPLKSRVEYIHETPVQKDLITLHIKDIETSEIDFNLNSKPSIVSNFMGVNAADLKIYADAANLPPSKTTRYFYSKKLRDLNMDLHIDSLHIENSRIQYEELTNVTRKPGLLFFNDVNATWFNLSNRSTLEQPIITSVAIKSTFMDTSPTEVYWSFDVANTEDKFNLKGSIVSIPNTSINSFMKPAINVSVVGEINKLFFNINGNHFTSNADVALNFDGFKINILDKEKHKKKVLTWLANLFIKDGTKKGLKEVTIENLERDKTKSFWNFFWKNIESALKKSLL